ncbi:putative hydrogenase nickel incorporation protein HypA [Nitrospira sp.]|nr:putative hydrogenase nickel incorporation protein HypA [Nitrospira sp.]
MHELHLMAQVVQAVEARLGETGNGRLSAVRLKVSALSHVMTHDQVALQMMFDMVARGTKAEGATLEIIPIPGNAWCPGCKRETAMTGPDDACSSCGASTVAGSEEPEVVVHELVVQQ